MSQIPSIIFNLDMNSLANPLLSTSNTRPPVILSLLILFTSPQIKTVLMWLAHYLYHVIYVDFMCCGCKFGGGYHIVSLFWSLKHLPHKTFCIKSIPSLKLLTLVQIYPGQKKKKSLQIFFILFSKYTSSSPRIKDPYVTWKEFTGFPHL